MAPPGSQPWGPGPEVTSTSVPPDEIPEHLSWGLGQNATRYHLWMTYHSWRRAQHLGALGFVRLDGQKLDIATVVAVAKLGCRPYIDEDPALAARMRLSRLALDNQLLWGRQIYGVNTGFGGSGDTRSGDFEALQRALIQHQQSAILTRQDLSNRDDDGEHVSHSMPTSWVRGSMLVRVNTTVRGHSAVRMQVVDTLAELIRRDMIPIVPLRGSISASGDLMPLAYIAGALQGNPDIFVRNGQKILSAPDAIAEIRRMQKEEEEAENATATKDEKADKALVGDRERKQANKNKKGKAREENNDGKANKSVKGKDVDEAQYYTAIELETKEGLALINGTAPSAAVAALAIYETNQLTVLAQLVTCLASEGLRANVEWAHPFLAEIRPLKGQMEVARNMRYFFRGSKLVSGLSGPETFAREGLVQDRYSIRSSPQWIGPTVEELVVAASYLDIELNSTTDNPVVNIENGEVYSGANFQATTVANMMEKVRASLQMLGKMLYSQATEMINPATSRGLPPNLVADNPSLSFGMKGVDINMAAYQSELQYLANPVTSHVQSAEMHNQAINSLALLSARYTMQSIDVLSMMTASAIYVGLQAVDLRALHMVFIEDYPTLLEKHLLATCKDNEKVTVDTVRLVLRLALPQLRVAWPANASYDLEERCDKVAMSVVQVALDRYFKMAETQPADDQQFLEGLKHFKRAMKETMSQCFKSARTKLEKDPLFTVDMLGYGTKALYRFVRGELGVPFHRGQVDDPMNKPRASDDKRAKRTVGSWITVIYEALRDGRLSGHLLALFKAEIGDQPITTYRREQADRVLRERRSAAGQTAQNAPSPAQDQPLQAMSRNEKRALARAEAKADRRKV